jgi:hypothetical protein
MDKKIPRRANGGLARASALTAEERSEIAKKAAERRWLPKATHQGTLKIADKNLPCAVLADGTRVIMQASVFKAFDRPQRGPRTRNHDQITLPSFLDAKNLIPYINLEVEELINPIKYINEKEKECLGYRAEVLPTVCEIYLKARADKVLTPNQESVAFASEVLVRNLSKVGIIALVDEATGYQTDRPQDALQAYLEMLVRKELAAWSKKFPDEFYENIYKLKNWKWGGMKKNRYSVVAHYTCNLVYERIAPGILDELKSRAPKDVKGNRKNKLHQWLTDDIGHPLLAQHLHSLIMFQKLAIANGYSWDIFVKMVDQTMPKKGSTLEMALPFPEN